MMGLVLHPQFLAPTNPKNFIYVAYVRTFSSGQNFTSSIIRFTVNQGLLESPVEILTNIPGSGDHNSGRLLVAPWNGQDYLFYAVGDMGAGQFSNVARTINSQNVNSLEGKILRINLEPDSDPLPAQQWIPNSNPYNSGEAIPVTQSFVWNIGHRNVQGLGYANGRIYAASHGPMSDDELNVLEPGRNYGHPLVIGYADGNYNNTHAALSHFSYNAPTPTTRNPTQTGTATSLPFITDEVANAAGLINYTDPIYSFFAAPNGPFTTAAQPFPNTAQQLQSIRNIYVYNPGFLDWPSIAPTGLDVYTSSAIPGWKNSVLIAALKKGYLMRQKLSADGATIAQINGFDTATVFVTQNRYRDLAISPDGRTIFMSVDGSGNTSGPTQGSSFISPDEGRIIRYTFQGYAEDAGGASTIPSFIPIAAGTNNTCVTATSTSITSTNNSIWVPITDDEGNIVAEVNGEGNNLGNVTASIYKHSGTVREDAARRLYLDRNITISVAAQPAVGQPARIRFYLTAAEYNALRTATNSAGFASGISAPSQLGIFRNPTNTCQTNVAGVASSLTESVATFGTGYVITADVPSFSTFFVANNSAPLLPISIKNLKASWLANQGLVQWTTATEENAAGFDVERSTDGRNFESIGFVKAKGNSATAVAYQFIDAGAAASSANKFFYRLRLKDLDGKYVYSTVVSIVRGAAANIVRMYPNPARNQVTLSVFANADETLQWVMTDAGGRVVKSNRTGIRRGDNTISIDLSSLPAGLYQLSVKGAQLNETMKLQKL